MGSLCALASESLFKAKIAAPSPAVCRSGSSTSCAAFSCTGSQHKSMAPTNAGIDFFGLQGAHGDVQSFHAREFFGLQHITWTFEVQKAIDAVGDNVGHGAQDGGWINGYGKYFTKIFCKLIIQMKTLVCQ